MKLDDLKISVVPTSRSDGSYAISIESLDFYKYLKSSELSRGIKLEQDGLEFYDYRSDQIDLAILLGSTLTTWIIPTITGLIANYITALILKAKKSEVNIQIKRNDSLVTIRCNQENLNEVESLVKTALENL